MLTFKWSWSLILAGAVVTAACGDSSSSLNPTAPSAVSADTQSAEAGGADEYSATAKPDNGGNGNGNNGGGNGNGNGGGGNGNGNQPRTPTNTSPGPTAPVPPGKAKGGNRGPHHRGGRGPSPFAARW